jgi:hypothetical protein
MNELKPDDELHGLFARLRDADQQNVPSFHAMRTRRVEARPASGPEASTRWGVWAQVSAAALVLAVTVLLAVHHSPPLSPRQPDLLAQQLDAIDATLQKSLATQDDLSAWQSPTDFLLPIHNFYHP